MANTVPVEKMGAVIGEILETYGEEIALDLKQEVKNSGKEAVKELKQTSPRKTGDYRKGWTSKVVTEKAHKIQVIVHNKTEYQIAHLLEYGHANIHGGRTYKDVEPRPHIAEAEKNAEEYLGKKIEIIVRK